MIELGQGLKAKGDLGKISSQKQEMYLLQAEGKGANKRRFLLKKQKEKIIVLERWDPEEVQKKEQSWE